ncbi:tyrosine-type recombinase/integrase [Aeromonas veronii]|uniref:tyrosine-type recombinase/integrase n=1 Tax=Aeromonas veronii TaxID=654 RepID=UPI00214DE9E5|nr:tyrosine-type recombinase/integrase [Aeromonas veronii]MCR3968556.1 tyrosine-type recombinase/integrase [Aeromonas veronii]MCR3980934.1 tyrosine-type recombinase/integrase [Aeromonas veronii]
MFIERRSNGVWYYKKTWVVGGTRKVTRKSLNTYDKKEAQLRAMQIYFNVGADGIPAQQELSAMPMNIRGSLLEQQEPKTLHDGFVVSGVQTPPTTPIVSEAPRPSGSPKTPSEPKASHDGFSSIVDAYLVENAHLWGTKESKAQRSAIKRFANHTNIKSLEDCTKHKAVEFKQSLITSGLSNITINKFIGKLSGLFDYIQAHYEHSNIFDGLKIKRAKQETTRTAYSKQEAQELIEFADKQQQHHKFMILLGLFTGCRANELAQLYTSDIVKIDGIWSILIQATKPDQKLKTTNASRIVPVHSELIKQGFIEFVKGRGLDCRLFPEFKYSPVDGCSKAFVQWFIQHKPVAKTYHEIRHSFATQLRAHDVSLNVAAQLLGHGVGAISFDRYGSTAQTQIHILKQAVEHVSYN